MSTITDIENKRVELMAEAETLHTRAKDNDLSPDEEGRLEEVLNQVDQLDKDLVHLRRQERIDAQKQKQEQQTRQAPAPSGYSFRSQSRGIESSEAMQLWFKSHTQIADLSRDAHYRAAQHDFSLGNSTNNIACDYGTLNLKRRAQLSKGGSNLGADLIPQSYSAKVVEYLTYFSPLVGMVDSETTADGNVRTYFKLDDTAMKSTYTTASAGTEIAPTIPDTAMATDNVAISCYDITSGYQKLSYQVLRDSAIGLEDKVAKANSHSHARLLEDDILSGSGSGEPQGLLDAATAATDVDEWNQENLEILYYKITQQYRTNAIFVANDGTAQVLRSALKDDNQRTLFDRSIEQGIEFDILYNHRFVISSYMPDDMILWCVPDFYMLRLVSGQTFSVLKEKFFPNIAYAGLMSWGGAWLGPDSACHTMSLA